MNVSRHAGDAADTRASVQTASVRLETMAPCQSTASFMRDHSRTDGTRSGCGSPLRPTMPQRTSTRSRGRKINREAIGAVPHHGAASPNQSRDFVIVRLHESQFHHRAGPQQMVRFDKHTSSAHVDDTARFRFSFGSQHPGLNAPHLFAGMATSFGRKHLSFSLLFRNAIVRGKQ